MALPPVVKVPLASIFNKFDVRLELDQDRVLQFVGMYEADIDVPPIDLVKLDEDTYAYIDGRHRAEAKKYMGATDIPARVFNGNLKDNPVELFARALQANYGGAKPPTRHEITHTIVRMIEAGASRTEIRDRLAFLPGGSFRAYHADASSILSKRRIGRALDAISEGAPIATAATRNKVPLPTLEAIISGKKGKWGTSRTNESQYVTAYKSYVSKVLLSANAGISQKLSDALVLVADGELSLAAGQAMIKAWKDHLHKTSLRIDDWQARLDSISTEQTKATGQEPEPKKELDLGELGPFGQKRLKRAKLPPSKPKPPKLSADQNFEYAGVRMKQGFWNEELPKAIRASGQKTPGALQEYFASHGKQFTLKQVGSALERLRRRGL